MLKKILIIIGFLVLVLLPAYYVQTDEVFCNCREDIPCNCPAQPFALRPLPLAIISSNDFDNVVNADQFKKGLITHGIILLIGIPVLLWLAKKK